jgi:protein-L-isoaspartate O-methyltransferase
VTASRDERRRSFDAAAESYATARPGYPEAVFDEIAARMPPPASVLEVGPGPGVATLSLAQRGYRIVAVELGENLARVARRRLAGYPSIQVVHADFHDWEPEASSFDMVFSASAFHWIEPEVGYPKAQRALRPGGLLALVWNHTTSGRLGAARRFWEETGAIYRRYAPSIARPTQQARWTGPYPRREIVASGLFGPVERLTWRRSRSYDADGYLALIGTYSDHLTLPAEQRIALLGALRTLIDDRFAGQVRREHETVLYLARRRAD